MPGSSSDRREHIISDKQIPRTDTKKKIKSPKKSKSRRHSDKQKKKKPTKQSSSCSASSRKKHKKKKKQTKQPSSGSASFEQMFAESFADYDDYDIVHPTVRFSPPRRVCAKMLVRAGLRCSCHFRLVASCPSRQPAMPEP